MITESKLHDDILKQRQIHRGLFRLISTHKTQNSRRALDDDRIVSSMRTSLMMLIFLVDGIGDVEKYIDEILLRPLKFRINV